MSQWFCDCDGCLNGEPCREEPTPASDQDWIDFVAATTEDDAQ